MSFILVVSTCTLDILCTHLFFLPFTISQNAEKLRRRSQSRKNPPAEVKRKPLVKPSPVQHSEEGDSENTESATESESNAEGSESESTITDSGPDDAIVDRPPPKRSHGSRKSQQSLTSPTLSTKTSEDVVDLFLTAAEALKNNISPDVALHDHSYSLPPSQLTNNMELQVRREEFSALSHFM